MNEESNSLYEKLEKINEVKHEIKQAIIDIGATNVTDDTKFEEYPEAIRGVHKEIITSCLALEEVLNGSESNIDNMYNDTYTYAEELLKCKKSLKDFLNMNDVPASDSDSFNELIEKLPKVEDTLREKYLNKEY